MTITLKGGKGYDAPWITIDEPSAEQDRARILATFGWDEKTALPDGRKVSEVSLAELTVAASNTFQGYEARGLRVAPSESAPSKPVAQAAPAQASAAQESEQADAPSDEEVEAQILQAIADAKDKSQVQAIYVDNKDFASPRKAIMDAMQERIKSFA